MSDYGSRLTRGQKTVLRVYAVTQSISETADRLGVKYATVNGQLQRARERTGLLTVPLIVFGVREGWL